MAERYRPILLFDLKEPFPVKAVGYTVFREAAKSPSFPSRTIKPRANGMVIEYAFWYDYDIQHLYELEHIWVYLNQEGTVIDAEASFHGKYLRLIIPESNQVLTRGERVCAYVQPGKHAMLAQPELFYLYPEVMECCMEKAGSGGIELGNIVADCVEVNEWLQAAVKAYIYEKYRFEPSFSFQEQENGELMCWEKLLTSIPERIAEQIAIIKKWCHLKNSYDNVETVK